LPDDDVALLIQSQQWHYFDDLEVHLGLDSHPTVGFTAPFDPRRPELRATFKPFQFRPLEVLISGDPLFTGVLVDVAPRTGPDATTLTCSGYSRAAMLEDVNLPADKVPFQAAGLSLKQIAERVAGVYGVGVIMDGPEGASFRSVKTRSKRLDTKLEHDQKLGDFLAQLAKQRGLVITSTTRGDLLFQESVKPGNPVARFVEGEPPIVGITPTFSPQEYYSEITGFTSAKRGSGGSKFTQRNERLAGGVLRALSFHLDDIEKGDAPKAVAAKMGRMFANCFSITLQLPTWRDPSGALWSPNTTVLLTAPGAMVYAETELLVRDVFLKRSNGEQTATLGCVLPGVFSGDIPAKLPWED
jgi:prophage tail gpP-like protein